MDQARRGEDLDITGIPLAVGASLHEAVQLYSLHTKHKPISKIT